MDKYEIKNHLLYVNGEKVAFKKTPNISGIMKPEIIVVHDTASPPDVPSSPINWLTNPAAKASAHFVVERNGNITQLAPTNVKTWHAGKSTYKGRANVNNFSIGIEQVNPGVMTRRVGDEVYFGESTTRKYNIEEYNIKEIDPEFAGKAWWMGYTEEQILAAIGIGQACKTAYGITDVVPHWFISPGRKVDTNPQYPLERVKNAILFGNTGPVTQPTLPPTKEEEKQIKETEKQQDQVSEFDGETTASLNIRPWPDSPNRFAVIPEGRKFFITRVSKSQKDGALWYLITINKNNVIIPADAIKSIGSDINIEGFVHSSYVRMLT